MECLVLLRIHDTVFQDTYSLRSEVAGSYRLNQTSTDAIRLLSFTETLTDYPATY